MTVSCLTDDFPSALRVVLRHRFELEIFVVVSFEAFERARAIVPDDPRPRKALNRIRTGG